MIFRAVNVLSIDQYITNDIISIDKGFSIRYVGTTMFR